MFYSYFTFIRYCKFHLNCFICFIALAYIIIFQWCMRVIKIKKIFPLICVFLKNYFWIKRTKYFKYNNLLIYFVKIYSQWYWNRIIIILIINNWKFSLRKCVFIKSINFKIWSIWYVHIRFNTVNSAFTRMNINRV